MSYRVLFENGDYENSLILLKNNIQNASFRNELMQDLMDECDLISSAFKDVEKDYIENIISTEDYNIQINKNKKRLLEHFTSFQNAIDNPSLPKDKGEKIVELDAKKINFDTILNGTIYTILLMAVIGISYSIVSLIKTSDSTINPYQSANAIIAIICCIVFFMCISFLTLRKRIILTNA